MTDEELAEIEARSSIYRSDVLALADEVRRLKARVAELEHGYFVMTGHAVVDWLKQMARSLDAPGLDQPSEPKASKERG